MAYTPINWQTGDTITAEKMNKMDNGWGMQESQLLSETVTTVTESDPYAFGLLSFSGVISESRIKVVFNNVTYECNNLSTEAYYSEYGAEWSEELGNYDFSTYPFNINSTADGNELYTDMAGSYTIAIKIKATEVSNDFTLAVKAAAPKEMLRLIPGTTTWQEVRDAIDSGKPVYCTAYGVIEWISWAGTDTHDDYVVSGLYCSDSSILTSRHNATGPDGVLN